MCLPFHQHKGEDLRPSPQLVIRGVFFCVCFLFKCLSSEKRFSLPGGVCMCAEERMCAYMSDEVFGNLRAGLIITDTSLNDFRPGSSWEQSVMPPDVKEKKMREREGERSSEK